MVVVVVVGVGVVGGSAWYASLLGVGGWGKNGLAYRLAHLGGGSDRRGEVAHNLVILIFCYPHRKP